MPKLTLTRRKFIIGTFLCIFFTASPLAHATIDDSASVNNIDSEIQRLTKQIGTLSEQEKKYTELVTRHQQQAGTLKNRLSDITLNISRTTNRIEKIKLQTDRTQLEIESLSLRVRQKNAQKTELKNGLSHLLQQLAMVHETSPLISILASANLTDAVGELDALEQTDKRLEERITQLQSLSERLNVERTEQVKKQKELEALTEELSGVNAKLVGEKATKIQLLETTRSSEEKYQALLSQIRNELNAANSEVLRLDKILRAKLAREGKIAALGPAILSWPVPGRYVTTYFHDPEYPFRKIFQHNAIDIRASFGTSVFAAAPGYVGKARDGGAKGYSYIMLIHGDEITTVYGHVSSILIKEGDYVTRGQQIGLSGGLPGTRGAGPFSTGAHLHFEVRKNGPAVDPLLFLPH